MLKIWGVANTDNMTTQSLIISVLEDGNLSGYVVADNTLFTAPHQREPRFIFAFPDHEVKKGDFVILYTCVGNDYSGEREGIWDHFFYWGINQSVWHKKETAHLLKVVDSNNNMH